MANGALAMNQSSQVTSTLASLRANSSARKLGAQPVKNSELVIVLAANAVYMM